MKKDCCSTSSDAGCSVTVKVDVAKIVRCICVAGVLIVAIIFGSKCVNNIANTMLTDNKTL